MCIKIHSLLTFLLDENILRNYYIYKLGWYTEFVYVVISQKFFIEQECEKGMNFDD